MDCLDNRVISDRVKMLKRVGYFSLRPNKVIVNTRNHGSFPYLDRSKFIVTRERVGKDILNYVGIELVYNPFTK